MSGLLSHSTTPFTGFLLRDGNRLFLPAIQTNVIGFFVSKYMCTKTNLFKTHNMSPFLRKLFTVTSMFSSCVNVIAFTTHYFHNLLKKLHLF